MISNHGNIWRKTSAVCYASDKKKKTIRPGMFKKTRLNENGYEVVNLVRDDGAGYNTVRVHRLIARAFIPNPNNFNIVHHKNSIRDDNRIENLEWSTSSRNNYYRWEDGKQEKHRKKASEICRVNGKNNRKISLATKIRIIKEYRETDKTQREISKDFNLSSGTISRIINLKQFDEDDFKTLNKLVNMKMDEHTK